MTVLASKVDRDALGIDTFERGFVYAALLLRAANTNPGATSGNQTSVRIALDLDNIGQTGVEPLINIQATIPYTSYIALRSGANFFETLSKYSDADPNPFTISSPPTASNVFPIQNEPAWVNTLERYLAWVANNLLCGFITLNPQVQSPVSLQVLEEITKPSLQINASLGFDIFTYLDTNNIIAALHRVIENGTTPEEDFLVSVGTP